MNIYSDLRVKKNYSYSNVIDHKYFMKNKKLPIDKS